jgi:hypothetical protein
LYSRFEKEDRMNLVALMPVRNEDWILALSAAVALEWCDTLVLQLHACTDQSREIAEALFEQHGAERVRIIAELDGAWDEMTYRQHLLSEARACKATHIAMIDADEVISANIANTIRLNIEHAPPDAIMMLPGFNLRGGLEYHASGIWANRQFSTVFRDQPRLGWAGDRFHHREPMGAPLLRYGCYSPRNGGTLHYWGFDELRLRAKHALYKVTERIRYPQKPVRSIDLQYNMWRSAADVAAHEGRAEPLWTYSQPIDKTWLWPQFPQPRRVGNIGFTWQAAEVIRLVDEFGREMFAGLDLFGIV